MKNLAVCVQMLSCCLGQSQTASPTKKTGIAPAAPGNRSDTKRDADKQSGRTNGGKDAPVSPGAAESGSVNEPPAKQKGGSGQTKPESVWQKGFSPETWGTWALAVIGSIGSWLALRTLRSIEGQTLAMVEGQRPQIAADTHISAVDTLERNPETPHVKIRLINRGLTPAYDLSHETWIEILSFPFKDFTSAVHYVKSSPQVVLYPHEPAITVNIPLGRKIPPQELTSLRNGDLNVCFRVMVTYRDAFSKKRRCINFGFAVDPKGLEYLPKYNGEC